MSRKWIGTAVVIVLIAPLAALRSARNRDLPFYQENAPDEFGYTANPPCKPGDGGKKVTCWPAPESPATMNRKQLGNLRLSDSQEDLLVAFLKTLTDGYSPARK